MIILIYNDINHLNVIENPIYYKHGQIEKFFSIQILPRSVLGNFCGQIYPSGNKREKEQKMLFKTLYIASFRVLFLCFS